MSQRVVKTETLSYGYSASAAYWINTYVQFFQGAITLEQ